jgi:hypothetical protein
MEKGTPIFEAIRLPSVRRPELKEALRARLIQWEAACHVTATSSLAEALWLSGDIAIPMAALLDLVVVSGRGPGPGGSIKDYPSALDFPDLDHYRQSIRQWASVVDGVKVRRTMQFDDALRQFARLRVADALNARLLVRERRQLHRAVQVLVGAGLSPDSEEFQPTTPIAITARDAWREVERTCPEIGHIRQDLWFSESLSSVSARTRLALAQVFGSRRRWTVIHHGFYFYTPAQWAFFRMLRETGLADQFFIVHDDGALPIFETWRRFFSARWSMPEPLQEASGVQRDWTTQAKALQAAWRGEYVSASEVLERLEIVEYRSPAEFVRLTLKSAVEKDGEGTAKPRLYAAQNSEVERYCDRLGPLAEGGRTVLSQLPVGAFLLRLHECIRETDDGRVRLSLSPDAVRDIAASGFLHLPVGIPAIRSVLSRAMPFFRDCSRPDEWLKRASSLRDSVLGPVRELGPRDPSVADVERLKRAVGNPTRLAPWADLSEVEVQAVHDVVSEISRLLKELASEERVSFRRHAEFLARHIREGMTVLPAAERQIVESKLQGFSIGLSGDIDVTGLLDVVAILLGRGADQGTDAAENRAEPSQLGWIRPLRSLDALGFSPSKSPIHVANLADGVFPSAVPAVGWPFCREDIADPFHIGRGLLETRAELASSGDLYLLWLALDGVEPDVRVSLSWISEIAGDPRSGSSVLGMFRRPAERGLDAVATRIGGLEVLRPRALGSASHRFSLPVTQHLIAPKGRLEVANNRIPREVRAMAHACPRWLALHWLFGTTGAHVAEFQLSRLYGNMSGVLQKRHNVDRSRAASIADELWQFLSSGEREGSRARLVVGPGQGASPEWIFTLEGGKNRSDPVALAYRSAAGFVDPPSHQQLMQGGVGFLPRPTSDKRGEVCKFCPAQSRCLESRRSIDEVD